MKKKIFVALAAFLLVATSSCKRTVEGENNRWNANKQEVEEMRAKYSNFEAAFDEIMEKAEAKMSEAESASSENASIKLMTEANSIIASSLVPKLKNFDSKVNDIEDLVTKAAQIPSDNDAVWTAKKSADRAIRDARNSLNSAQINNLSAAESIVSSAMQNLDRARSRLNNVISEAKEKQNAKEKAEEDKNAAEDAAKAKEEKKTQPVKCGYCGKMNDPNSKECGSCGAPVEG